MEKTRTKTKESVINAEVLAMNADMMAFQSRSKAAQKRSGNVTVKRETLKNLNSCATTSKDPWGFVKLKEPETLNPDTESSQIKSEQSSSESNNLPMTSSNIEDNLSQKVEKLYVSQTDFPSSTGVPIRNEEINELLKLENLLTVGSGSRKAFSAEFTNYVAPDVDILLKKYKAKYPKHATSTLFKTFQKSAATELSKYYDFNVHPRSESEIFSVTQETLAEDYMNHIINHQEELDSITMSIYNEHIRKTTTKCCSEFDRPSPLKASIIDFILSCSLPLMIGSRKALLQNGVTEVQLILSQEYNYDKKSSAREEMAYKSRYRWANDPWHPIHLSFGFHYFQRTVNTFIVNPPHSHKLQQWVVRDNMRNIPTYTKYYIDWMNETAVSNDEFLLAVISAYGTEASKYPSTVFQYMEDRDMLKHFSKSQKGYRLITETPTEPVYRSPTRPVSQTETEAVSRTEIEKSEPRSVTDSYGSYKSEEKLERESVKNSEILAMKEDMIAFQSRAQPAKKRSGNNKETSKKLNSRIDRDSWNFLHDFTEPKTSKVGTASNQKAESSQRCESKSERLEPESEKSEPTPENFESESGKSENCLDESSNPVAENLNILNQEMENLNVSDKNKITENAPFVETSSVWVDVQIVPESSTSPAALTALLPKYDSKQKNEFLKTGSYRIVASTSDAEVMQIADTFCEMFLEKTTIEKTALLRANGLLDNLPRHVVTILNVTEKFGKFLGKIFENELTLEWYMTLAQELHADFLPVWVDLLREVGRSIRQHKGQEVMQDMFRATKHKDIILGMLHESE